jgi:hypothetical protein
MRMVGTLLAQQDDAIVGATKASKLGVSAPKDCERPTHGQTLVRFGADSEGAP